MVCTVQTTTARRPKKKVTVHPTLPEEGNEDGPRGRQIPGSVGQFACHQTYVTPLPPFQRILWGLGVTALWCHGCPTVQWLNLSLHRLTQSSSFGKGCTEREGQDRQGDSPKAWVTRTFRTHRGIPPAAPGSRREATR